MNTPLFVIAINKIIYEYVFVAVVQVKKYICNKKTCLALKRLYILKENVYLRYTRQCVKNGHRPFNAFERHVESQKIKLKLHRDP